MKEFAAIWPKNATQWLCLLGKCYFAIEVFMGIQLSLETLLKNILKIFTGLDHIPIFHLNLSFNLEMCLQAKYSKIAVASLVWPSN